MDKNNLENKSGVPATEEAKKPDTKPEQPAVVEKDPKKTPPAPGGAGL